MKVIELHIHPPRVGEPEGHVNAEVRVGEGSFRTDLTLLEASLMAYGVISDPERFPGSVVSEFGGIVLTLAGDTWLTEEEGRRLLELLYAEERPSLMHSLVAQTYAAMARYYGLRLRGLPIESGFDQGAETPLPTTADLLRVLCEDWLQRYEWIEDWEVDRVRRRMLRLFHSSRPVEDPSSLDRALQAWTHLEALRAQAAEDPPTETIRAILGTPEVLLEESA